MSALAELIGRYWEVVGELLEDGHLEEAEALYEVLLDLEELVYRHIFAKGEEEGE